MVCRANTYLQVVVSQCAKRCTLVSRRRVCIFAEEGGDTRLRRDEERVEWIKHYKSCVQCYLSEKHLLITIILPNFAEEINIDAMVRYPVGIQTFSEIRKRNCLYVDKTQYVYELANDMKYVFLSRPRRFGKSLLTSTFGSYFSGRQDLFSGLSIEKLEKDWTEYPVLHFSLAMAKMGTTEDLFNQINMQLSRMERRYGLSCDGNDVATRFFNLVTNLYDKTGSQVVVLIDEYDAPLLTVLHDPTRLEPMRTALQSFYSPLKDLDPYLHFVFITGITKFSQLSIFSQLNNLTNISMDPQYSTLVGFTQEELKRDFKEGIQGIADNNGLTCQTALEELRTLYDGYHFSRNAEGVYNPFSVLQAMRTGSLDNYWFATGTPSFLVEMMKKLHTNITQIDGNKVPATEFDAPTENMRSVLPLFYQSGYLTIKDYSPVSLRYTLGYPNEEVKVGLMDMFIPFFVSPDTIGASNACWDISEGFLDDDVDKALSAARSFFASIPYQEGTLKNAPISEGHFTAMLYVMFSFLNRYVYSQVRTSNGRLDILVKTHTTIYVMELKMDGSADEALQQIDDKGYTIPYETDGRKIVKVAINFSSKERTIKEWKVKR